MSQKKGGTALATHKSLNIALNKKYERYNIIFNRFAILAYNQSLKITVSIVHKGKKYVIFGPLRQSTIMFLLHACVCAHWCRVPCVHMPHWKFIKQEESLKKDNHRFRMCLIKYGVIENSSNLDNLKLFARLNKFMDTRQAAIWCAWVHLVADPILDSYLLLCMAGHLARRHHAVMIRMFRPTLWSYSQNVLCQVIQ